MLVGGMIVVGLAMLLVASIPQTWAPIGRTVRAVNTALPFGPKLLAEVWEKDEAEVQDDLVKAARVVFGLLGVLLILGAAIYGGTG